MKTILGLKSHSGWAALVVVSFAGEELEVIDRRRIELVSDVDRGWAKQPYHAAEPLESDEARVLVKRAIASAQQYANKEMRAAVKRARNAGYDVAACAVLVGDPMPDWTVDEILAVHFRMHKAEGALFQDVLCRAAERCGLSLTKVSVKGLAAEAKQVFGAGTKSVQNKIDAMRKVIGSPWGTDQKEAALAAAIAWRRSVS